MALFRRSSTATGEELLPLPLARNQWSPAGQIRGAAVSGALARAAERRTHELSAPERFRPIRWAVDLFRPAAVRASSIRTTVVRQGKRLHLVDAEFVQGDLVVARASLLSLAAGKGGTGRVWPGRPVDPGVLPRESLDLQWYSDGVGWTSAATAHRNDARKILWTSPVEIVDGEKPTTLQHLASVADSASLLVNWGDRGVEFINADMVMHLSRLPGDADRTGLAAATRTEDEGIAVGTATLFDRDGLLGTVVVTAVANSPHAVDPEVFNTY